MPSSPGSASARCGNWPSAPSGTFTPSRSSSISSGARAGSRASCRAAPWASTRCCASRCSTPFPTILEIALVAGILAWSYGWLYALVILVTVLAYVGFTYAATEWRINIRRDMNAADTEANTKAVDSLLNFETVKYFGNEEHEARRYARSMDILREGRDQDLGVACRAELRPGGGLFHRPHHRHGDVGARRQGGHRDGGRLRDDQRPDDPALHAAQLHRLLLPRDQAGADRRGADVHAAQGQCRDRGQARRKAAGGQGRRGRLRERELRL